MVCSGDDNTRIIALWTWYTDNILICQVSQVWKLLGESECETDVVAGVRLRDISLSGNTLRDKNKSFRAGT